MKGKLKKIGKICLLSWMAFCVCLLYLIGTMFSMLSLIVGVKLFPLFLSEIIIPAGLVVENSGRGLLLPAFPVILNFMPFMYWVGVVTVAILCGYYTVKSAHECLLSLEKI